MIEIKQLSVGYGTNEVLRDLSLELPPGQLVLLTGRSGCGKTTLARAICGLIPHALPARIAGHVFVQGLDTQQHPLPELSTHVGLVLQDPAAQLFCTTVEEEVASGPLNLGLDGAAVAQRTEWALDAVGVTDLRGRPVRDLSGGEQQRVTIAAALAMRPPVLLLDEPTSNLDANGTTRLLATLRSLKDEHGVTILVIEHRPERLAALADRVLLMDQGKVIADGPPDAVFADRELLDRLGIRYPWHAGRGNWQEFLPQGISESAAGDGALARLESVSAGYGRTDVLRDVQLTLWPGELTALVGLNGAGKSTLGRVLAGLLRPRRGRVHWRKPAGRVPRVGLVLQDPLAQLLCDTVEEEAAFGPRNYGRYDAEAVHLLLREADLGEHASRAVLSLSSGQQQRLAVAAVASLEPELLIVDEPTLGQDWGHLSQMIQFLYRLNQQGTTIVLITHDAKLICRYAPRVIVLESGRVVADGPPRRPVALPGTRASDRKDPHLTSSEEESV